MKYLRYTRRYVGPVRAVILDWSGTVTDRYALAPVNAIREVFENFKCPISVREARADSYSWKHCKFTTILRNPAVRQRWEAAHQKPPTEHDIEEMFKAYIPIQMRVLPKHSNLLPGTVHAVHQLRYDLGCKVGITTCYLRSMADILLKEALQQGLEPDADVTKDEVENGARPLPNMLYKNVDLLNVAPIESVVKVDDSIKGISEGLNAGCWSVGMARYSEYMHIESIEQEENLTKEEIEGRLEHTRIKLRGCGAHYVINTIVELPEIVADINSRLAKGHKP